MSVHISLIVLALAIIFNAIGDFSRTMQINKLEHQLVTLENTNVDAECKAL